MHYPRPFLALVSWLGWLISRLGPIGHDMREWAQARLRVQRRRLR